MHHKHKQWVAVGLSSSPVPNCHSRILLDTTLTYLQAHGVNTQLVDLSELPAEALLGRRRDVKVDTVIQQTVGADIIILATPVCRATYTGQLKAFIDLLPQAPLCNRTIGLIATGVSPFYNLGKDESLRSLVMSLSGNVADALYINNEQFPDQAQLPNEIQERTIHLAHELYVLPQIAHL